MSFIVEPNEGFFVLELLTTKSHFGSNFWYLGQFYYADSTQRRQHRRRCVLLSRNNWDTKILIKNPVSSHPSKILFFLENKSNIKKYFRETGWYIDLRLRGMSWYIILNETTAMKHITSLSLTQRNVFSQTISTTFAPLIYPSNNIKFSL